MMQRKSVIMLALTGVFVTLVLPAKSPADLQQWVTLDFPGATETRANGIDGETIVGSYKGASGDYHGYLYDGATWTTLEFPGAERTYGAGTYGDRIVGSYDDAAGYEHGFIYTIPEPATILLLSLGGIALVRRRR